MPLDKAGNLFGGIMVVTGLLGTFIGGFLATAWRKRNRAGYALLLGCSTLGAVPFAVLAFTLNEKLPSEICLAAAMFFLFFPTGPVNTLILETVPANLQASSMALSIFMMIHFVWRHVVSGDCRASYPDLLNNSGAWRCWILPGAAFVGALLWLALAWRTLKEKDTASHKTG